MANGRTQTYVKYNTPKYTTYQSTIFRWACSLLRTIDHQLESWDSVDQP